MFSSFSILHICPLGTCPSSDTTSVAVDNSGSINEQSLAGQEVNHVARRQTLIDRLYSEEGTTKAMRANQEEKRSKKELQRKAKVSVCVRTCGWVGACMDGCVRGWCVHAIVICWCIGYI